MSLLKPLLFKVTNALKKDIKVPNLVGMLLPDALKEIANISTTRKVSVKIVKMKAGWLPENCEVYNQHPLPGLYRSPVTITLYVTNMCHK